MQQLEDYPPPVPQKDTPERYTRRFEHSSASVSKRKREDTSVDLSDREGDYGNHTPKRHRLTSSIEGTSPQRQSTLRRKKGVNNLSTLNLRHEAERARLQEQPRESKFQEGSLTDKPSQRPPSTFLRYPIADPHDTLMSDYHDGMPTPDESVHDTSLDDSRLSNTSTEQSSALYRFGQKLATSFRPVALWSKLWNETKEELTQRNIEADRKRREKLEAEKQYALMKHAGQIPTKRVSLANLGTVSQRDSGIVIYDGNSSHQGSSVMLAREATSSRAESNDIDGERTLRGRLHFRKPSLNNLRWDLKRTRSDMNLFATNRDSSGSMSPVKAVEEHTLQRSPSKADLKKQQRLSKRVSDLELKLRVARQELTEAIFESSPMPRSGRHERPMASRKFIPGLLPSLPSERLLDADTLNASVGGRQYNDETIRASRMNRPRRAADLFEDEAEPSFIGEQSVASDGHAQYNHQQVRPEVPPIALATPASDAAHSSRSTSDKKRKSTEQLDFQSGHAIPNEGSDARPSKQHKLDLLENSSEESEDEFTHRDAEQRLLESRNPSVRSSIDSTTRSLEPLYEEEEDVIHVPLNGDPSKPTATATPARFGRFTRSMSPVKDAHVRPGAEEIVITRAAEAVRQHPGRQARSRSPAKNKDFEWPDDVF